jgi:hypothetical protein
MVWHTCCKNVSDLMDMFIFFLVFSDTRLSFYFHSMVKHTHCKSCGYNTKIFVVLLRSTIRNMLTKHFFFQNYSYNNYLIPGQLMRNILYVYRLTQDLRTQTHVCTPCGVRFFNEVLTKTEIHKYIHTPWSRVLPEKLKRPKLLKKQIWYPFSIA